jgi:hypothetical protein
MVSLSRSGGTIKMLGRRKQKSRNTNMFKGNKNPDFLTMQQVEGNMSIVPHPHQPAYYGDGSLEVEGSLATDVLASVTPSSCILVKSPLSFLSHSVKPEPPTAGYTNLYALGANGSRLVMENENGGIIDLNPLREQGDLATFSAEKNGVVRIPIGLPGQTLQAVTDENGTLAANWGSSTASVSSANLTSTCVRYLQSATSSRIPLSDTPIPVSFNTIQRLDPDAYTILPGGEILVHLAGFYEFSCKISVQVSRARQEGSSSSGGTCVRFYAEQNETSSYTIIPGAEMFLLVPGGGDIEATIHSGTLRFLLRTTDGTRMRILAHEHSTTSGALFLPTGYSVLSIDKLVVKDATNDTSEYVVSLGGNGDRLLLLAEEGIIPCSQQIIYATNANDVILPESIVLATAGTRHIFAHIVLEMNNFTLSSHATVECSLKINGTILSFSRSFLWQPISGSISIRATCTLSLLTHVSAGSVLEVSGKIIHPPGLSETVNVDLGKSSLTSIFLNSLDSSPFIPFLAKSTDGKLLKGNTYKDLSFKNILMTDYEYDSDPYSDSVTIASGGTYRYFLSATFQNTHVERTLTVLVRGLLDTGRGYLEIPGSESFATLGKETSSSLYSKGTAFIPPNARLKFQCISFSSDSGRTVPNGNMLILDKLERTIALFPGVSSFGRFYTYVEDEDEMQTTSTDFSLRFLAQSDTILAGFYRIGLSFEWDMTEPGVGFDTQFLLDDTKIIGSFSSIPVITGTFQTVSLFKQLALDEGPRHFTFCVKVRDGRMALMTRNIRFELWRV